MADAANSIWKAANPTETINFLYQNNVTYVVVLWGGLQKAGASIAVFIGIAKGLFSPMAAMVAGFDAAIVLKRGLEGSLAPSTSRATGILCAVRTPRGHLFYQHFEGDTPAFSTFRTETETKYEQPQATENARLVRQFMTEGHSTNADFDNRVRFAHALYGRGLDWIEGQLR